MNAKFTKALKPEVFMCNEDIIIGTVPDPLLIEKLGDTGIAIFVGGR